MPKLSFDFKKVSNDPRFRALSRRLGGDAQAWLVLLRFWDLAMDYWGARRRLVPEAIFDLDPDFQELLSTTLAERRADGIYAKGGEDAFDWYAHLRGGASEGGRRSAESRIAKYGTASPIKRSADEPTSRSASENTNRLHEAVQRSDEALPSPSISISSSTTQNKTSFTPPIIPLPTASSDDPKPTMSRGEQRATKQLNLELAAFAEGAAAEAFAAAEGIKDPMGNEATGAWVLLGEPVRKFIRAAYPGNDKGSAAFPRLIGDIRRHRGTKSPDTKFRDELRETFRGLVFARPDLRPSELRNAVNVPRPSKTKNVQQEPNP